MKAASSTSKAAKATFEIGAWDIVKRPEGLKALNEQVVRFMNEPTLRAASEAKADAAGLGSEFDLNGIRFRWHRSDGKVLTDVEAAALRVVNWMDATNPTEIAVPSVEPKLGFWAKIWVKIKKVLVRPWARNGSEPEPKNENPRTVR